MTIEIVYPRQKKKTPSGGARHQMVFCGGGLCLPHHQHPDRGKPWSIIVLWALWFAWSGFVSRDLIEYNRISQTAKLLVYTCILLVLIGLCLSPGWLGFVIPIVSFATLMVIGVLFFSNLSKQKQNMMPMVWLIGASFVAIIASLSGWPRMNWPMAVLGTTAVALLAASILVLKKDLLRELRKRFHTK
jgi:hypothetical protein